MTSGASQIPLTAPISQGRFEVDNSKWQLSISSQWDVLGPFPIHAREQHFLSPSFPLNLSEPINFNKTWPSSYADGGRVHWSVTHSKGEELHVSFPDIRWASLRATEGWAALQHHAVLRTTLTIHPPTSHEAASSPPQLRVNIKQGSYFTVLPHVTVDASAVPEWHAGNIYDIERALPRTVDLPSPLSLDSPTVYQLFVSGDYEIRLFGDPHTQGSDVPVQTIGVQIQLQEKHDTIVHEPTQDIIPDFAAGYAVGEALGIGIRSISGWWTVDEVRLESPHLEGFNLQLKRNIRLAPSQLRVIPLSIVQKYPIETAGFKVSIKLTSKSHSVSIPVSFNVTHKQQNSSLDPIIYKASFFFMSSMPSLFLVIPPTITNDNKTYPIILALHGAGVDIFDQDFWIRSLPKTKHNWIVVPSGRTSWGLDWHGSSANDVWDSLAALNDILSKSTIWKDTFVLPYSPVIAMGHSNGGQGVWYLASRFPDRILGAIPTAAYIKSQAYIPLTMSRSAHFIDPGLRAILESSLTLDDNDIHLSNLANVPILVIHGGDDENVPVWHSRESVGIIDLWSSQAGLSGVYKFREDPGQGHWYPTVLDNEEVMHFIGSLNSLYGRRNMRQPERSFTVTTSDPHASGTLNGWKIEHLRIPGRIGRLYVDHILGKNPAVRTSNVRRFSVNSGYYRSEDTFNTIQIDDSFITFQDSFAVFERHESARTWELSTAGAPQSSSRIQTILSSSAPLHLIISDLECSQELSTALRVAHDLHLYHRLDARIIDEKRGLELLAQKNWVGGNIVFIGRPSSNFVSHVLHKNMTPIELKEERLYMNGLSIERDEQAILFLHPNPLDQQSVILFLLYKGYKDLERAARLFPIRTGIAAPSWVMIDGTADELGAAGVYGAGVWGPSWGWNAEMSWYY